MAVKDRVGFDNLPGDYKQINFEDEKADENEVFEDSAAYWLLKAADVKRPLKASYTSNKKLVEDKVVKHIRGPSAPTQCYIKPVTTNHDYGWYKPHLGGIIVADGGEMTLNADQQKSRRPRYWPIRSSEETRFQQAFIKSGNVF